MTLLAQRCDQKLGQILIKQKILTEQNLSRVLDIQERNKKNRFGDYLVENHSLRRDEIEATLKEAENNPEFPKSARIGEILISSGITNREQVNTALINQQKPKNEKIGSLLIKNGLEKMQFNDQNFRESEYIRLKVLSRLREDGLLSEQLEWANRATV